MPAVNKAPEHPRWDILHRTKASCRTKAQFFSTALPVSAERRLYLRKMQRITQSAKTLSFRRRSLACFLF